jgi:mono/diheme cytochrome c family protein
MRSKSLPLLALAILATVAATPAPTRAPARHVERGEQAFLAYCAGCHGSLGHGDGETAIALKRSSIVVPRLDNANRLRALGRDSVLGIVRMGGAHVGRSSAMPQWSDLVGPELAENVVDFVMTLPEQGSEAARAQHDAYLKAPPGVPEQGREIYVHRCSSCHGPDGRGDGPSSRMLKRKRGVRPADLTSSRRISQLGDRQLYEMVALGGAHVARSVYMPAWNHDLAPEQIKSLVAYIRTISHTAPRP